MTEPEPARTTSPFSIPIFRMVWIASLVSNFGALIQSVGASWLMTSLTSSPTHVALVQASTSLPLMLLSLPSGAIADNYDRRKVMLLAQCFMLLVSVMLAVSAWKGMLTPWLLLSFTFLIGMGTALNNPSWQASVGEMVPRASLPAAVALNSMGFNIARSLGPAVGGAIVAAAGAAVAFLVNALTYLGLIAVLARWRAPESSRPLPRESIGTAMEAGIRYVSMSPHIRVIILRALLFGMSASAILALMPLVARGRISGGPLTYGILLGAFGIGAVTAALIMGRVRQDRSTEDVASIGMLMMAIGTLVTGLSTSMIFTVPALFVAGLGWILTMATFNVSVQMASPRWVVGRALSIYQTAAFGGMALGSWLSGELTAKLGVSMALITASVALLLVIAIRLRFPLPQVETLNLNPLSRWAEPDIAIPIQPRSGPIVITIDYRITSSSIPVFLTEMAERRRIRIRDGARHWTLLRDLHDAELWIERFHLATWVDYVRFNQRRTHADVENAQRIHALHLGPEPPRVHRMIERQTAPLGTPVPDEIGDPLTDPIRSS